MSIPPLILANTVLQLDNIRGVGKLRSSLDRESRETLSSPTLLRYVHREKYGYPPPEVVYIPDELPWQLEFSFLPQKFFFEINGKTYFDYENAYDSALLNKERWQIAFLRAFFPELRKINWRFNLLEPLGKQLTKEQIEYIGSTINPRRSTDVKLYIDNLADYGDIDYFLEMLEEKGIEPSPRLLDRFARRMVQYGKEDLLEAYNRFGQGSYRTLLIKKYHPDQRGIPGLNPQYMEVVEDIINKHFPSAYKNIRRAYRTHYPLEGIPNAEEYKQWETKNHPKDRYKQMGSIDYYLDRGNNLFPEEVDKRLVDSLNESDYTWPEIAYLFTDWDTIQTLVNTIVDSGYWELLRRLQEEDTSGAIREALKNVVGSYYPGSLERAIIREYYPIP